MEAIIIPYKDKTTLNPRPTDNQYRSAFLKLRALSHRHRIRIVNEIIENPTLGRKELAEIINTDHSSCSHQIRILVEGDIITRVHNGKYRNYRVNEETLFRIHNAIENFKNG